MKNLFNCKYVQLKKAMEAQETMSLAEQTATAIYIIVKLWQKYGLVFLTPAPFNHYNAVSSYANWLYLCHPEVRKVFARTPRLWCMSAMEYEKVLEKLSSLLLSEQFLEPISESPAQGNIFKCPGPFAPLGC